MEKPKVKIEWEELYEGIILEDWRTGNYVVIHDFGRTHACVGIGYGVMVSLQMCEILPWFRKAEDVERLTDFISCSPGRKVGDYGQWDREETDALLPLEEGKQEIVVSTENCPF